MAPLQDLPAEPGASTISRQLSLAIRMMPAYGARQTVINQPLRRETTTGSAHAAKRLNDDDDEDDDDDGDGDDDGDDDDDDDDVFVLCFVLC